VKDIIALDRASVRSFDKAGHLRVALTPISKAAVNPYLGKEIADGEALGLLPDKVYHLYRDPAELKAAVASFNGKPLMLTHRPQTAGDHAPQHVVGAVHDAQFDGTYMLAALEVWDQAAIDLIESGEQRQLSSGYFYTADMTPGVADGVRYDGVMRKITANHVALVEEGRAGPDVMVGDSAETLKEHQQMAKQNSALSRKALLASGALRAYLAPKMASDHKMPDVRAMVKTATHANWTEQKPKIVASVQRATKGKLAADASLEDLVELLDQLDDDEVEATDDATTVDPTDDAPATDNDALSTFLKGLGLSDEDVAKACEMAKPAPAASDEFPPKDDDKDDDKKKDSKAMDDKPVSRAAMDAALAVARTQARQEAVAEVKAIHAAHEAVRPYVGEVALDSADAIYEYALKQLQIDIEGVPPAAYPKMLKLARLPGEHKPTVAMDAAGAKSFSDRFPSAARIRQF
jgi:hypothetical protein